jgi:phosphopantothenoylcysteine decarboxylase / phosphopantothenate---cysteine ligase
MAGRLNGLQVLITAGPTHEYIDDVRFLGNPSTGRMGVELARAAQEEGAEVTVVMGPTQIQPLPRVHWVPVVSAEDMLGAVIERVADCHVFIAAAAVADYRPAERVRGKMKKAAKEMTLKLVRTRDILKAVGKKRRANQTIVGYSLESTKLVENGRKKLEGKNCDLILVNTPGHFGDKREQVLILSKKGIVTELPPMGKRRVAQKIIDLAARHQNGEELPVRKAWDE